MTPNGAILLGLIVIVAAVITRDPIGLTGLAAFVVAFGIAGGRILRALLWSAGIVLPLAAFMGLVWIGFVGRAPHEIAAGIEGSRIAAATYVAAVCLRLAIMALAVQLVVLRFSDLTPLQVVRRISAPLVLKKLLVLTLSLIETMLHAIDRARTALIVSGVITRGASLRNFANGWILVQTVWLTTVTIVIGRLRDKWPTESTLSLLDHALAERPVRTTPADWAWVGIGLAVAVAAWGLR